MSVLATSRATLAPIADREKRHRLWLGLGILAAIALAVALAAYGYDYYTLAQAARVFSPKHAQLKPSGTIGLRLGMLGFLLFLLVYLYPIRKRWAWLGQRGSSRHWLNFHVLLGLAAPVVITFHSSFKFHGIAGLAYWIMVAVALSGVVGRYIYAQIPRSLNSAEVSLKELRMHNAKLADQLNARRVLNSRDTAPLFQLPEMSEVQTMRLLGVFWLMLRLDLSHPVRAWNLRRRALGLRGALLALAGFVPADQAPLEQAIAAVRKQAALSKKVLLLSKSQQLFHFWHVVHRPFSYSFALLACLHVLVVLLLGYF